MEWVSHVCLVLWAGTGDKVTGNLAADRRAEKGYTGDANPQGG